MIRVFGGDPPLIWKQSLDGRSSAPFEVEFEQELYSYISLFRIFWESDKIK